MTLSCKWFVGPPLLLALLFAMSLNVGALSAAEQDDESARSSRERILLYDSDRDHLWNRLHETFFVRRGPDGRNYGYDRLEPLLWFWSKHLLEKDSNQRAVAILDEFIDDDGEKQIDDPLKRAILQRDLLLVFSWLERPHRGFAEPQLSEGEVQRAQQRLRGPLAKVIGRLALSREQIEQLPNNYAAALASKQFSDEFDPDRPTRPYLPTGFFDADGPWICVGRTDGRTAPRHLQDLSHPYTNSVFYVFLSLPAGRAATAAYLKRIVEFKAPLLFPSEPGARRPFYTNPQIPQFPKGTRLALVRQALLLDDTRGMVASPLIESIQLRVMRAEPPTPKQHKSFDSLSGFEARIARVAKWQTFQEFQLRREPLFRNHGGGFLAVAPEMRDFKTGFGSHPFDAFESPLRPDQSFLRIYQITPNQNCYGCHSQPGVFSFNSFQDFRSGVRRDGDKLRPNPIAAMTPAEVERAALKWQENRPYWIALRKLLAE